MREDNEYGNVLLYKNEIHIFYIPRFYTFEEILQLLA